MGGNGRCTVCVRYVRARAVALAMVSGGWWGGGGFFQVSSKTSSFSPAVCRRAPCPLSIAWQKGSSVRLPNDNGEGEEVFKEVHVINDCSCIILAFFLSCRAPRTPPPPRPVRKIMAVNFFSLVEVATVEGRPD